jgi:hypothetical protein
MITEPIQSSHRVRVTVPVSQEVLEAFQRLAAAQGVSTGRAMGEWLSDTVEGADYMASLLLKARTAPKLAVRELHAYATGLTDLTSELVEDVRRRSAEVNFSARSAQVSDGADGLTPPVSNTGGKGRVNPNKKLQKKG